MRRLCIESSCSYSGRSAWQAVGTGHGSRTEDHGESRGATTGPYRRWPTARPAATRGVTRQKSAETIVVAKAGLPERRRVEHE
jgi:hypothetical protein